MDWTVLQHVVIALVCIGIGWICGQTNAGAAFGSALFIGREQAQAEYRWIEQLGGHLRANMPWYGGFDPRAWTWSSLFDWLIPLVVCVGVALVMRGFAITEEDMRHY